MENKKTARPKENYTLTEVGFGNKILINQRVYTYQGQDRRKGKVGSQRTVLVFKLENTKDIAQEFHEKIFEVNANFKIKKIIYKPDDSVKYEMH